MEISIDLYRRRRSTRFEANVAFRASVGRGDFTIGGDFTSVAVGYNDGVDSRVGSRDIRNTMPHTNNIRDQLCREAKQ